MEKRKSKRNIYNQGEGIEIRANLYVIKYIYYHINKARCFYIESEREKGKKRISRSLYSDYLNISRQRFDRINNNYVFELTQSAMKDIIQQFGIGEEYFRKEDPVFFKIDGISSEDWKQFYDERHARLEEKVSQETCSEEAITKINEKLKKLVKSDWNKNVADKTGVYAVLYFFSFGKTWDARSKIEAAMEMLTTINVMEWDDVALKKLDKIKEYKDLLEKHYMYVDSVIKIMDIRSKK